MILSARPVALAGDASSFDRIDREIGLGDGPQFPALLAAAVIVAARVYGCPSPRRSAGSRIKIAEKIGMG